MPSTVRRVMLLLTLILSGCVGVSPRTPPPSDSQVTASPSQTRSIMPNSTAATASPVAPQTSAASPGSVSPTPTVSPAGTAVVTHNLVEVNWRHSDQDPGFGPVADNPETDFRAAVVANRFVLGGADYDTDTPRIWTSVDGVNWHTSELEGAKPGDTLYDLAAGDSGGLAVGTTGGYSESVATAWRSSDGRAWTVVNPGVPLPALDLIAPLDGGYAAAGFNGMFWSSDGGTWAPVSWAANGRVDALIPSGGELSAFVVPEQGPISLWRSEGHSVWTQVSELPKSSDSNIKAVDVGPLGWVVLGARGPYEKPVAWFSSDGVIFQRSEATQFPEQVSDAMADASGFVAVGFDYTEHGCALDPAQIKGVTLISANGLSWARMPGDAWDHQRIDQLLRLRRTLIGVGVEYREADDFGTPMGTIWTARLPILDGDAPAQEPLPATEPRGCVGD